MPTLALEDLLAYTDWQRTEWQAVLRRHDPAVLGISAGPHGDGRFDSVGDVIRHIFSAECRYVERLSGRPLTDTSTIPTDDLDALFAFGRESRETLRRFLTTFPTERWDVPEELTLMAFRLRVTPRKILAHVVTHEIRHWAQIGTLLRLQGVTGGFQDLLFSPALGGEIDRVPNAT